MTDQEKKEIQHEIVDCLSSEKEIRKIVVFGSFVRSIDPHDVDIAIFQESSEDYLPLALKYRKKTRGIARKIPLDIFPLKKGGSPSPFLSELSEGITIYER